MKNVVVLDNISDEGLSLLEEADGVSFEIKIGLAGDELRDALRQADGAVCRSGVKITPESIEGNRRLKAIVRAGVGTDNIDRDAATRHGIIVMNTPTGNTISTAEHTMALILALSRNIPQAQSSLADGKWDRKKLTGSQLAGKTLGIIGLGRIGQAVATRAKAFEMKVLAMDPYLSQQQADAIGVEAVTELDNLLPRVDYLTVHTPMTNETRGLIGKAELEKMPKGARLVNCARGGIYDEQAIVEGIESGHIGGVALDVYENEPCTDSPLFSMPHTVCTPHLGASTEEAQKQVAVEAVSLLIDYLQTGNVRHAVNAIPLDPAMMESIGGFLNVGYRLGSLLAQWHGGAIENCHIELKGQIATRETRLLQAAVCAGLIDKIVDDDINLINADFLCRERGISLELICTSKSATFQSSMNVQVAGQGVTRTAGGTVFGSEMPRLIRLDECRLEAFLDGHLLLFFHHDVPGVVGRIGKILGDRNINIAQMAVGRTAASQDAAASQDVIAVGVFNLDTPADRQVVDELESLSELRAVTAIDLPPSNWVPPWMTGIRQD